MYFDDFGRVVGPEGCHAAHDKACDRSAKTLIFLHVELKVNLQSFIVVITK